MCNDYVIYIDTDSIFLKMESFILDRGINREQWDKIPQDQKIKFIQEMQEPIKNYVNEQSMAITQKIHYNSQVDDFFITFEPEKLSLSSLFAKKKRYANWVLINDGAWSDSMKIAGMEIVRSDSPEIAKPLIKKVLEMILKNESDEKINDYIQECKEILKKCSPEEIAENKGVKNIEKYVTKFKWKIRTPHHVKGVAGMRRLIYEFDLENKYELPSSGNKAKVVYLKKNRFKLNSLSFLRWPDEFNDRGIFVDMDKMIHNNFIKKIHALLEIIKKEGLIDDKKHGIMESLFG